MIRRRLRRVIGVLGPIAAVVIVLFVLHGAGVPLSVPGVILVFLLLVVGRLVVGLARRRRVDRK